MSEIAIRVEKLSKRYRIGLKDAARDTLAGTLADWVKSPGKNLRRLKKLTNFSDNGTADDILWALRDVSFEVKQGEVVGVIGRNGAGKSTLLKILSRITQPTSGRVELHGRVSSLLEVGTGFHPELTGRENIYLNGTILGMSRKEIDQKFDEIVDFSGIEKFIDTPVKRYSSGMGVRLAFSVAAHLEPEILLVDEVLAVGDAEFQRKCLGKMGEVAKGGRTVLFVSHQLNQIRRLCSNCIWIDNGKLKAHATAMEVVSLYEASVSNLSENNSERGRAKASFVNWEIFEPRLDEPNILQTYGKCKIKFRVRVEETIHNAHHGIALWTHSGQLMWGQAQDNLELEPGLYEFIYQLPSLPLRPGPYRFQVSLYENQKPVDNWHAIPDLIIAAQPTSHPRDEWSGILNFPNELNVVKVNE